MKRLAVLLFLVFAAPASAYDHEACPDHPPPPPYTFADMEPGGRFYWQSEVTPIGDRVRTAAEQATGSQYASMWLRNDDETLRVGLAPGPLTTEQARAGILDTLRPEVTEEELARFERRFVVSEQPYAEADLRATQRRVEAAMPRDGFGWTAGIGCSDSDAMRVSVTLFNDSTPEQQQRVRELVSGEGDRVVFVVSDSGPPRLLETGPPPRELRARTYVRFKCTARGLRVRRGTGAARVLVGSRKVGARGVFVRRAFDLTVVLPDGQTLTQRISRRCG